jgi:hypothetical protein
MQIHWIWVEFQFDNWIKIRFEKKNGMQIDGIKY